MFIERARDAYSLYWCSSLQMVGAESFLLLFVDGRRCDESTRNLEFHLVRMRMHHYMVNTSLANALLRMRMHHYMVNTSLANDLLRLTVFISPVARHGAGNSLQDT